MDAHHFPLLLTETKSGHDPVICAIRGRHLLLLPLDPDSALMKEVR